MQVIDSSDLKYVKKITELSHKIERKDGNLD